MKIEEITKYFLEQYTSDYLFVEIYSTWCAHCKMIRPLLEELEEIYTNVEFVYFNMDSVSWFSKQFEINSVPTLLLIHKDKVIWHHAGYLSYEELDDLFKVNIDKSN